MRHKLSKTVQEKTFVVVRWAMVIGLAMFCSAALPGRAAEARFKDYEVKAGFLHSFTKFIEWPTNRFHDAQSPFVIGVAGPSLGTPALKEITQAARIGGRPIVIKVLASPEAVRGAHLLFLPAAEDARLKDWLAAAHGAGVLTIGESDAFFKQGGIINFVIESEKIRFDINIGQAEATGLKISAQLQKLAKSVRRK